MIDQKPGMRSTSLNERRQRPRLQTTTEGWIIPDAAWTDERLVDPECEPWEVRITDISRNGVGFESTQRLQTGEMFRVRIGRGPMRLARRIRIVNCRAGSNGHYAIGAQFIATEQNN